MSGRGRRPLNREQNHSEVYWKMDLNPRYGNHQLVINGYIKHPKSQLMQLVSILVSDEIATNKDGKPIEGEPLLAKVKITHVDKYTQIPINSNPVWFNAVWDDDKRHGWTFLENGWYYTFGIGAKNGKHYFFKVKAS